MRSLRHNFGTHKDNLIAVRLVLLVVAFFCHKTYSKCNTPSLGVEKGAGMLWCVPVMVILLQPMEKVKR